ncbi:MAG: translation initiation factor IF-2 [Candidatus Daviesbacteria bacterium]
MSLQNRPPVVTILGHVDHGKTTLLDYIRKTSVAVGEFGGITQAIGAYQVRLQVAGGKVQVKPESENLKPEACRVITFIDTPGHAAFEKMRSRGAQLADIAILIVAVDDGVMPQTVEAIKHIQAVGIPMIVAVTKVDLPGVNVKIQLEKIKKQLSDQKILVEEYGGDVPIVEVSGKTGQGVDNLLETIILVSDIHEFKGDPDLPASGVVIEAHLDKSRGSVATILIRDGSLQKGDVVLIGGIKGKVRGMFDWEGKSVEKAIPSMPIELLGLEKVPDVGAHLGEEGKIKEAIKSESLLDKLRATETNVLNVIIKTNTQGSLEAIQTVIDNFNQEETHIKIIIAGTGEIVDSDIEAAIATKAIVLGFNVKAVPSATKIAETEHILIRIYNIIYELIDELEDVVKGLLEVREVEEVFGRAQIVAEFPYGKLEKIAGAKVLEGTFSKGPKVRIMRGDPSAGSGQVIGETKIKSLKRAKEEVQKVEKGQDFGAMFEPTLDFQIGDIIESFRLL